MNTEQNGSKAGTPSPERLGSTMIYCARCGCRLIKKTNRRTGTTYYSHKCSKGHKGSGCGKPHVEFVNRLTPEKLKLLRLGMEELKRRFALSNSKGEAPK